MTVNETHGPSGRVVGPARDCGGLVFALDVPDLDGARRAALSVGDAVDMLKVGLELFVAAGPAAIRLGEELKTPVFLDLKLHDIPETVERAVATACALGAKVLTVHGGGGAAMLERAVRRADQEKSGLAVAAVTVLTSLDDADLAQAGIGGGVRAQVLRLARLGWSVGVRAFVCSPREVATLRAELGPEAVLITPGIRGSGTGTGTGTDAGHGSAAPSGVTVSAAKADDQKRVATASQAVRDGASWVVVGRPIRDAQDPRAAARALREEIDGARRADSAKPVAAGTAPR